MTVHDHPERSMAQARGDLAQSLVPLAAEFAFLVRTEGREAIGAWLDGHGITDEKARALLVVTAAGWPIDATNEDTLSWVTFNEYGEPLDGTIPLLPCLPAPVRETILNDAEARRRGYAGLRAQGIGVVEAAARLGVHRRTAARYEAQLAGRGEAAWLGTPEAAGEDGRAA